MPVSSSNHKIQSDMIWFGCLHKFHNSKIEDCDLDSWFTEVKRSQKEYYSKWAFFWKIWIILKRAFFLARFVFRQPHSGRVYKISDFVQKQFKLLQCLSKQLSECLKKFVSNIFIAQQEKKHFYIRILKKLDANVYFIAISYLIIKLEIIL